MAKSSPKTNHLATGIELQTSVATEKSEHTQHNLDEEEHMRAGRFNNVIAFFSFSLGVFSFGVIHDFVQESVFRIEGFDYGLKYLIFSSYHDILLR